MTATLTSAPAPALAPAPSPMTPEPVRILQVRRETAETFTLRLAPPRPGGFTFAPGQFNMLYVFGVGEVAISISGDPARTGEIVHTVRAVGAVTRAMCRLRKGETLGLRGPYGRPWPMEQAKGADVVLVAGGLGLAPLRPAVYHLLHHRADHGRVVLLTGARTPQDLLYRGELARWRARKDFEAQVTVDRADPAWSGAVGVVPALLGKASFDPARAVAFVCGPEVMMRFTVRELNRQGVTDDRIYLSLERNMKCALGLCGRCQLGPDFLCKDGPVLRYDRVRPFFNLREA